MTVSHKKMEAIFRNEDAEMVAGFKNEACERTKVYGEVTNMKEEVTSMRMRLQKEEIKSWVKDWPMKK